MFNDELMELLLEDKPVGEELIRQVDPRGDHRPRDRAGADGLGLQEQGRAAAAGRRLPLPAQPAGPHGLSPATTTTKGPRSPLVCDPDAPLVAMAFKIVDESFGQLTYTRVYQGTLAKGQQSTATPARARRSRVGRIVRMHANEREDIDEAGPGDIVAMVASTAPAATPSATRT